MFLSLEISDRDAGKHGLCYRVSDSEESRYVDNTELMTHK